MNLKLTLSLFFCLMLNIAFSQTKLIAHKSHSGSSQNFKKSLQYDLFDIQDSNFGMVPSRYIQNANLDSLIYISKTQAVMVTSNTCEDTYEETSSIWEAGRDTVINHPLFSKKHALDSIKIVLAQQFYFSNPIDSIVFIGYDNCTKEQNQEQSQH